MTIDTTGLPEYHGTLNTPRPADLNLGPVADIPPTPALADALEAERQATDAYEAAAQAAREADRAARAADRDHDDAVRQATRDGKNLPTPPKADKLHQAAKDTKTALSERAAILTAARQRVLDVARAEYPALRAAAVNQLDATQEHLADAFARLRAAVDRRADARLSVARLDAVYAEDWARREAGMTRPTTRGGTPPRQEAEMFSQAATRRRAQTEHALRSLSRELEADAAFRQAIDEHAPETFTDSARQAV